MSVSPHTGYTHQIRAHLLSINFPILGDPLYFSSESSQFSQTLPIQRTALHAYSISFTILSADEQVTFTANLPEDFLQTSGFSKVKQEHPIEDAPVLLSGKKIYLADFCRLFAYRNCPNNCSQQGCSNDYTNNCCTLITDDNWSSQQG